MESPRVPEVWSEAAQQNFNGASHGAIDCLIERLNRMELMVPHIHDEQTQMIGGVKSDLNGALREVRAEINEARNLVYIKEKGYTALLEKKTDRIEFVSQQDKFEALFKEKEIHYSSRVEVVENGISKGKGVWVGMSILGILMWTVVGGIGKWGLEKLEDSFDRQATSIKKLEDQHLVMRAFINEVKKYGFTPEKTVGYREGEE